MKSLALFLAAALLAGCATASKTYAPDGRVAHSIDCSGGALSWSLCYTKAGEICGARGYDELNKNTDQSASFGGGGGVFGGGVNTSRTLLIACK